MSNELPGFQTDIDDVRCLDLDGRIDRAIELLRLHEPEDGYYLAFSGGKDSCVIKYLAQVARIKFEAWHNNTTIDPPELIRFIKKEHPDVQWNHPEMPMMKMVAEMKVPPTRVARWCCDVYKEQGGNGRTKLIGVRSAESSKRAKNWKEIAIDNSGNPAICPIVYWTDEHVWELLKTKGIPYCSLYDEGWKRLGCVGCPLSPESQAKEFLRRPAYERNWKKAVISNWEKFKDSPRIRDGKPRFQAKFKTGEEFWQWWLAKKTPDYLKDDCQSQLLWTNGDMVEEEDLKNVPSEYFEIRQENEDSKLKSAN